MEREQRILELQERIDKLSGHIHSFEKELQSLRSELNALRNNPVTVETGRSKVERERPVEMSAGGSLENYIGLRFMHVVGIIVFVTGLSIGVKYAIDRQLISEAMRIILAYLAGAVLFILSIRLKKKYHFFSAILFSGSMASVYFTTYAAFVYYHFFPDFIAFMVMVALTIYTVFQAMSYNRQEIAILGMIGAYGIPFLVSANAERVDLFFSYILLINLGVAFISFKRSWKWMQYLALLITWSLFIGWALMRYNGEAKTTGILFMIAYYCLFFLSAIARHLRRSSPLLPGEIQQVALNNIAMYLAAVLLFGNENLGSNLASTTGFVASFIALLALSLVYLLPAEMVLQRLVSWQAIVLVVVFIGLEWEGLTVTLLWLAVAVSLFAWGAWDKKSWPRLASILLIGLTLGKLIVFDSAGFSTVQKIISFLVIGILLLLFSFYYQKYNREPGVESPEPGVRSREPGVDSR